MKYFKLLKRDSLFSNFLCSNINGLFYRVYLTNNEKVFSFHYFYLRNKILTLKFLNFFNNCNISMINLKTLSFLLYNRRLDKIFFDFRYNKLQYLLFA